MSYAGRCALLAAARADKDLSPLRRRQFHARNGKTAVAQASVLLGVNHLRLLPPEADPRVSNRFEACIAHAAVASAGLADEITHRRCGSKPNDDSVGRRTNRCVVEGCSRYVELDARYVRTSPEAVNCTWRSESPVCAPNRPSHTQ